VCYTHTYFYNVRYKLGTASRGKYIGPSLPLMFELSADQSNQMLLSVIPKKIFQAKAGGKKLQRVALSVNLHGIKVVDLGTEDTHLEVSIYR